MPFRLTLSPLAAARRPLDGLRLRGWAHTGVRPLDGLLMDRAGVPSDWRAAVRVWLEHAEEVRRHGDLVLVLFPAPRVLDCAALGPFVGLVRHGTSLAAAPYAEPEAALAADLRDRLVLVRLGVLQTIPLASFQPEDVADWWAPEAVEVVASRTVPGTSRPMAPRAVSASAVPPDPQADAIFATIREGIANSRRHGFRAFADDAVVRLARGLGRAGSAILILFCVAGLAAAAILLVFGFASGFWSVVQPSSPPEPASTADPNVSVWPYIVPLLFILLAARPWRGSAPVSGGGSGGFLHQVWHLILRGFGRGRSAPAGSTGSGGALPREPRRTPLWKRMGAWLAWHSPIGANIRRRYAERVADIERLFAAGRLDEALRKALKIGADTPPAGGAFGDLPLTGPGLRERIALDLSGRAIPAVEALADVQRARLEALYRLHARNLAKAGDVDRGAFILAELLNAPAEAARLLADHGRFETAARLGEARRLAPAFVIPLWFKAGNTERALALAARHDLFAELWKEVRAGDPFRETLADAWCERLADAGAYEQAAAISAGVAPLAARRRDWIFRAVESGERAPPNALARALVALDWRHDPPDRLYARFIEMLAEPGASGASRRLALAVHLADPGFEPRRPAEAGTGLRLVTHELTRRLAADEGVYGHLPNRAGTMAALAEAGGHFALRHDLRKLRKIHKPKQAEPDRRLTIEAGPALASIADAVILPDHQVLIGYRSGLLRLVGGGRELWRGQVNGFIGFVTVGAGERVIVMRQGYDELTAMVFATGVRQLTPWGALPIVAWHGYATETGWLVCGQDGAFTMLDTVALLRPPSDAAPLVHHWSIAMSEPGRPLALLRGEREAVLVWARIDGLVEWWSVNLTTLKVDCRFWTWPPAADPQPPAGAAKEMWETEGYKLFGLSLTRTYAAVVGSADLNRHAVREDDSGAPFLRHCDHVFASADRAGELALLAALETQPRHFAPMIALHGPSHWAMDRSEEAAVWCGRASDKDPTWSVAFRGAAALAARFNAGGTAVVIHDDLGRLIALDLQNDQILLRTIA